MDTLLQLSPSKKDKSPIFLFPGQPVFIGSDSDVTGAKEAHIELFFEGDGLQLKQIGKESYLNFAEGGEHFTLSTGDNIFLPLGGSLAVAANKEVWFTLEKCTPEGKKGIKRPMDENKEEKVASIVAMFPEIHKEKIQNALETFGWDFDQAVDALLNDKKECGVEDENLAAALQLQEEELGTSCETSIPDSPPQSDWRLATLIREEDQGPVVIPLDCGVVLFKGCLSVDQQIGLFSQCEELERQKANVYSNPVHRTAAIDAKNQPYPIPMLMLNWGRFNKNTNSELPEDFVQFAKNTFHKGYKNYLQNKVLNSNMPNFLKCPSHFNADAIYAILYSEKAKLQSHQDSAQGWVLSVSIGNSCIFSYSLESGKNVQKVRLDSGDVVLFNGQRVFHAVEKILVDTAPKFWNSLNNRGYARFNLQFRDSQVIDGKNGAAVPNLAATAKKGSKKRRTCG